MPATHRRGKGGAMSKTGPIAVCELVIIDTPFPRSGNSRLIWAMDLIRDFNLFVNPP
jgi:hypothetical protein